MKIQISHINPDFVDERGGIARVVDQDKFPIRAILRITSKAGSIRANHYHKHDYHYIYIESGKCEYSEKPVNKPNSKIETITLNPGDLVLTNPGIIHAVKFLEDTVFYAFTTEKREQDQYEGDTVRITIVEEEKSFDLKYCRLCKSKNLKLVLDLGKTALANSFLKKEELVKEEPMFPLALNFCLDCGQLQTTHVVSPELMFRDYVWVSSTSPVTVSHFEEYANSVFRGLKMKKNDLVVEMGSNDGVLLKPFKKLGAKVLGVDPARNVAERTTKDGILTLPNYFNPQIAQQILNDYGKAKVIAGNNVFAHIHDLDEILKAVDILLDDNGSFIIEFPYLIDFIEKNLFDITYHEHLSYLAIGPLDKFFKNHGMQIFDVVKTPVHGGSTRVFVKKHNGKYNVSNSVNKFMHLEEEKGLHKVQTYDQFAKKVKNNKEELTQLLKSLKRQNKKIVGYGAPAKGNTLLSYFGIDNNMLDYIVDDSKYKHGLFTPGTHIPVTDPSLLEKLKPDYVFILAWNFAEPIMNKLTNFKKEGGLFIIPVPKPYII